MQFNHYTKYVETLPFATFEPTEFFDLSTFLPTPSPTIAPTVFINRIVEQPPGNNPDTISMIVAISLATSVITTCCLVCGGIYCYYLRNHLKRKYLGYDSSLDSLSSSVSSASSVSSVSSALSEKIGIFELDDIYCDYWGRPEDTENPQKKQSLLESDKV